MRKAVMAALAVMMVVPGAAAETVRHHRAIVADHLSGKITVIDLADGRVIADLGVRGPARLKASEDGRLGVLTQGAQNRVDFLDTGVTIEAHGDHLDLKTGDVRILGHLAGPRPSHINFGNNTVAVFFDGDGTASVVAQPVALSGQSNAGLSPRALRTAAGHHGLAAPMAKGMMAMTVPHPTDSKQLPVGIAIVDGAGKEIGRSENCPRLHGEAKLADVAAFGCEDGLLLVRLGKQAPTFEKVAYPEGTPTGWMVRNLLPGRQSASLVGDFGTDGMVVFDPTTKGFTQVQLPARRMHFTREALLGDSAFVVTEDGVLHRFSALTGKMTGSLKVTDAYAMEGGSAVARPRISASGDMLAVTDPAKALVHIVDLRTWAVARSVSVPGTPFDVLVLGGSGEQH